MNKQRNDQAPLREGQVTTEEELQEKWKDHPSPFVQAALAYRREKIGRGERFLTVDEINAEVERRRGYADDGQGIIKSNQDNNDEPTL